MRRSLILTLTILFYLHGKAQQTLNFSWKRYDTSSKIDVKGFSALTEPEAKLAKDFADFADNRARLTLWKNDSIIKASERYGATIPVICECRLKEDTIFVKTLAGFFGGAGVITAVHRDRFAASFIADTGDTNVFKQQASDTAYVDEISVAADTQKLTLFNQPSFVDKEIIIGTVEGQFKPFYEWNSATEPLAKSTAKAKVFFKCQLHAW